MSFANVTLLNSSPYKIRRQKIEIMHIEQGKLCVTNVDLCAKLSANNNKKSIFLFI